MRTERERKDEGKETWTGGTLLKIFSAAVSKLSLQQLKLEGVGFDLVFPVFARYINTLYSTGLAIQGQHCKGNKRKGGRGIYCAERIQTKPIACFGYLDCLPV